jgi:hypothetical protein
MFPRKGSMQIHIQRDHMKHSKHLAGPEGGFLNSKKEHVFVCRAGDVAGSS